MLLKLSKLDFSGLRIQLPSASKELHAGGFLGIAFCQALGLRPQGGLDLGSLRRQSGLAPGHIPRPAAVSL